MSNSLKTNRLAILSFVSGCTALFAIILVFVLYDALDPSPGMIGFIDGIIIPGRNLAVFAALVAGVLALIEIKRKGGTRRNKIYSWFGVAIGAGWVLFGSFVSLIFLLGR